MTGDIAGSTGIVVDSPGTAKMFILFQDKEIVYSCLFQLDAHAKPTEATANDDDFVVVGGVAWCRGAGGVHFVLLVGGSLLLR